MPQRKILEHDAQPVSHRAGYRWLAEYYDEFFAPFQTPMNRARSKVLSPIVGSVRSACDLGGGTGNAALQLAKKGIRVYLVDRSAAMCRIARQKVHAAHLPVRVLHADMRSFRLPEAVDLVMCEGDALNHIPHKSDLGRVARAAFRALHPGGHFFFDVNNRLGFLKYWTGTVWFERPGVVMVMRNAHAPSGDRASTQVEWFLRERGGGWRRHHELVKEICWTATEITRAIHEAGFGRLQAWDASPFFGGESVVTPGCRTVYLAQRPK